MELCCYFKRTTYPYTSVESAGDCASKYAWHCISEGPVRRKSNKLGLFCIFIHSIHILIIVLDITELIVHSTFGTHSGCLTKGCDGFATAGFERWCVSSDKLHVASKYSARSYWWLVRAFENERRMACASASATLWR